MSAEAWRRTGPDWRHCILRGRCGTFSTSRLDLRGRRGAFRAFIDCHRCPRSWRRTGSDWRRCLLRGRRGTFSTSGSICVAGVALSGPSYLDVRRSLATNWAGLAPLHFTWQVWHFQHVKARFAWQAWRFQGLHIDCHRCPRKLGDELARIWRRWILRGRRDTCSTSGSICMAGAAEAWRRIGSNLAPLDLAAGVAGVALAAPQAPFAWQA